MNSHALLMPKSGSAAQIWDIQQAVCLRTLAATFHDLDVHSALNDTFFVEARVTHGKINGHELHNPIFWSAHKNGPAAWQYLRRVNASCLNVDECTLAVAFLKSFTQMGPFGIYTCWDQQIALVRL